MKHEKTFEAIGKLKDIEIELHRLKNALEMANKALDAQRTWIGLTDAEVMEMMGYEKQYGHIPQYARNFVEAISAKLKEKNT